MAGWKLRLDERDAVSLACVALGAMATLLQALALWPVYAWLFPPWPRLASPRPQWASDLLVALVALLWSPHGAALAWLANTAVYAGLFLFAGEKLTRGRGQGA